MRTMSFVQLLLVMLVAGHSWAASSDRYCKFKYHTHRAEHIDGNGRKCSDIIKIQACGGYCQSHEIAHWQFPYKMSNHLVCEHGERRPKSVRLQHCDPGVQPGTEVYHYMEAVTCKCQKCSSENTSCEWLPPDMSLLGGVLLKEELSEEPLLE